MAALDDDDDDDDEVEWEDVDVSEECERCGGTGVLASRPPRIGLQGWLLVMLAHKNDFAFGRSKYCLFVKEFYANDRHDRFRGLVRTVFGTGVVQGCNG